MVMHATPIKPDDRSADAPPTTAPANLLRHTVVTGSLASLLSMLVLTVKGRQETGSAAAPLNAPSHWLYGDEALHVDRPSARYTLSGAVIHHASAMMWAFLFEGLLARVRPGRIRPDLVAAGAAAVTATAALVDLKLVPSRFTPGFEHRLSRKSLWLTYGAFAAGLALGGLAHSGRGHRSP